MITRFWTEASWQGTIGLHVIANTAAPLVTLSLIGFVSGVPGLGSFALTIVAPWAALASAVIATTWLWQGKQGRFPSPPKVFPAILVSAIFWTCVFGAASLVVAGFASRTVPPLAAALDGAISGGLSALMSGIAIVMQARSADRRGAYR